MTILKKPYRGFLEIKKPNLKKCHYCQKKNCDWKIDINYHINKTIKYYAEIGNPKTGKQEGISNIQKNLWLEDMEKRRGNESYHKICVFKKRHYGIHPDKWNTWQKENKISMERTLDRDNNECQLCFGEVQKYYIIHLEKKILEILQKDGARLEYKKRLLSTAKKKKVYVHHIQKVMDGGSNELHNLITVCRYCHDMIERAPEHWNNGERFGINQKMYDLIFKRYNKFKTSPKVIS